MAAADYNNQEAATDCSCLSLAVSPTHTTARCAPCMCPPNKVLWLTMYPMCKSTANPLLIRRHRYVGCPLLFLQFPQLLQLRFFDASLPRTSSPSPLSHPILPSDIPPCPGVSRRDHHGHSPLLPTPSLPSVSHAVTEPPATPCCQLPLTNPFTPPRNPPAPPITPSPSTQASLLSCSHPASALPYRPCFLPTHTAHTPAIPICLLYHLPYPYRILHYPSRCCRPSFFNRPRSSCTPRRRSRRLKPSVLLAFHSRHHLSDGIMGIMETSACRSPAVRDPCHETLADTLLVSSEPLSTLLTSPPMP